MPLSVLDCNAHEYRRFSFLNDPVAQKTNWTKSNTKMKFPSYNSNRKVAIKGENLKITTDNRLERLTVLPFAALYLFASMSGNVPPFIPLVAFALAFFVLIPRTPVFISKSLGRIWKGKYKESKAVSTSEAYALQLISTYDNINYDGTPKNSELNLVLKTGQRVSLLFMKNHALAKEVARKIGDFLKIPIWDATHTFIAEAADGIERSATIQNLNTPSHFLSYKAGFLQEQEIENPYSFLTSALPMKGNGVEFPIRSISLGSKKIRFTPYFQTQNPWIIATFIIGAFISWFIIFEPHIAIPLVATFSLFIFQLLKERFKPIVFDKKSGFFWNSFRKPNEKSYRKINNTTPLQDIIAVQIIKEKCTRIDQSPKEDPLESLFTHKKIPFDSYEINLVLRDCSRINVVDHGFYGQITAEAETIALFLEVPIWNLSELETERFFGKFFDAEKLATPVEGLKKWGFLVFGKRVNNQFINALEKSRGQ